MSAPATLSAPRIETRPALLIAGLRQSFRHGDAGIPLLWQRFQPLIAALPESAPGTAYGLCLNASSAGEGFDYMAGVAVSEASALAAPLAVHALPAGAYAVFRHEGHVSGVPAAAGAIFGEWLPLSGERPAPGPVMLVEFYNRRFDPRSGLGGLELWLPLARP